MSAPRLLQGKRALITGGTSGIGEATAELFVKEGARVIGLVGTRCAAAYAASKGAAVQLT